MLLLNAVGYASVSTLRDYSLCLYSFLFCAVLSVSVPHAQAPEEAALAVHMRRVTPTPSPRITTGRSPRRRHSLSRYSPALQDARVQALDAEAW